MHLHPHLTDQLLRDRHERLRREVTGEGRHDPRHAVPTSRRLPGITRLNRGASVRPREHERTRR